MPGTINQAAAADALIAAGLPVDSVSVTYPGGVAAPAVVWLAGVTPTAQQSQQAAAILASPSYGPRSPLPLAQVLASVQSLSQPQLNQLVAQLLAERLLADPTLGARAGVAVAGDQAASAQSSPS